MDGKKELEKTVKQEESKNNCLVAVVKNTDWSEEEAIEKIENCRQRLGISYNDYRRMKMYQYKPEEQEAHYLKELKKRERQKLALEKCANAIIDETGWSRETTVKNIKDSIKRLGIQYRDYFQMELFRVPPEEQEACYQRLTEEAKEDDKSIKPMATKSTGVCDKKSTSKPRSFCKSEVCAVLGIPFDGEEEIYSGLDYATEAHPGSLAFLERFKKGTLSSSFIKEEESLAEIAFARGATRVLCCQPLKGRPCLVVSGNLFEAVKKLIRHKREQYCLKCVEVTGSYGKTTTMNMIEAVLESRFNVFGIQGKNCNTVRRTISRVQKLNDSVDFFLQEASEAPIKRVPGAISEMVHPDVAVITSIGSAHIGQMGSLEEIASSCLSVQDGMTSSGRLVLNGDNILLRKMKKNIPAIYYGIENPAVDFRGINISEAEDGIHFDVLHEGERTPVRICCYGKHNVINALAAFAAGALLGLDKEAIADGLSQYRTTGIRQNLFCQAGFRFYLDCYNASVESIKSALDTISSIPLEPRGRRVAVLADVKETGRHAKEFHEEIGRAVRDSAVDILICYGEDAKYIAQEARKKELLTVFQAESHKEIAELLRKNIRPEDLILLKGSHAMELARVPDLLLGTLFHEYDVDPEPYRDIWLTYNLFDDHVVVQSARRYTRLLWIPDLRKNLPVTSIGACAFENAEAEMVVLPTTLNNIQNAAFRNMSQLKTIRFPNTLQMIDSEAFSGCIRLKRVEINDGCQYIGSGAFRNCGLQSVSIPASVCQIEEDAFDGCEKVSIHCERGTYAESFALRKKLSIVYMAEDTRAPEAPYMPKIANISNKGIEVYWKKPEIADGYCIYRSYNILGPYKEIARINKRTIGTYCDSGFDHEKRKMFYTVCSYLEKKDGLVLSDRTKPVAATFREGLMLDRETCYLYSGTTKRIHAYYGWGEPEGCIWASDNTRVAYVEEGVIHAINSGSCTITCYCEALGQRASSLVVVDRSAPEPLSLAEGRYSYDPSVGCWKKKMKRDVNQAVIMMVGDMMCGLKQQTTQYNERTGYCFNDSFQYVREVTSASDLAIGNLETLLASGWPYMENECYIDNQNNCNAPARYLDAVRYGGFDALVMANNHNCDGGTRALRETLDQVNKYRVAHTGVFYDKTEPRFLIADVNGIKVGLLSFTSREIGFNRKDTSWTQEEKDSMLHVFSIQEAERDIRACREAGAEYIIVYMHWGEKNFRNVLPYQIKQAQEVADVGADYIVGSNPHMVQSYDEILSADGRTVPCFYSVGNFQSVMNQIPGNRDSVMARICLRKENDNSVKLVENAYIPFFTYNEVEGCRWTPIALTNNINKGIKKRNCQDYLSRIQEAIGEKILPYDGAL